jgi:transketolase
VVLVATGSEVEIAVAARETLEADGIPASVVSMPCVEWFTAQDDAYRAEVLPAGVPVVTVEAAQPIGWKDLVGCNSKQIGIDHFGASAAAGVLYREFGITPDAVVVAAKELVG